MNATIAQYAAAQRHRITVDEARTMQAARVFGLDADFELIDGELIFMGADGGRTIAWNAAINRWLVTALMNRDDLVIVPDKTLVLSENHGPKPDFYIYPAAIADPEAVRGPDTLLVIEIADTPLGEDLGPKAALYEAFGVREYWFIDCAARCVHVHRRQGDGFAAAVVIGADKPVPAALIAGLSVTLDNLPRLRP